MKEYFEQKNTEYRVGILEQVNFNQALGLILKSYEELETDQEHVSNALTDTAEFFDDPNARFFILYSKNDPENILGYAQFKHHPEAAMSLVEMLHVFEGNKGKRFATILYNAIAVFALEKTNSISINSTIHFFNEASIKAAERNLYEQKEMHVVGDKSIKDLLFGPIAHKVMFHYKRDLREVRQKWEEECSNTAPSPS